MKCLSMLFIHPIGHDHGLDQERGVAGVDHTFSGVPVALLSDIVLLHVVGSVPLWPSTSTLRVTRWQPLRVREPSDTHQINIHRQACRCVDIASS